MTAHDFCSTLFSGFDLTKKCFPHTFLAPQAAKNLSVRLNTCLNTSFLVSTPADQHLFPRLNTWLLNAESCLNVEPQALVQKIKGWSCLKEHFVPTPQVGDSSKCHPMRPLAASM